MLSTCSDTLHKVSHMSKSIEPPCPTFCELTARLSCAKSDCGSTVPKKIDLYWFMPAFVNNRVGSERGTTDEEGTVHTWWLD